MQENIFLIGFMGCGKSHWGKIWARKNNLSYFDLDAEIEKAFQLSVSAIFETRGEEDFRKMEKDFLRKFGDKKGFLLSCGGGTPCFSGNLEWMEKQGKVIYLKANPETILKNVLSEIDQRPLLKDIPPGELLLFIKNKLKGREPLYGKASFMLNVEELNENSLAAFLKQEPRTNQ